MNVYLDDEPLAVDRPTLAAALCTAAATAGAAGRIIIEVTLNGQPVPEQDLAEPPEADITGAEIRLVSADPHLLVSVTLHDAAEALDRAREDQQTAGRLIQQGKVADAMLHLSGAMSTWQDARAVLDRSAALLELDLEQIDLSDPEGEPIDVSASFAALGECLDQTKRSLEAQDWSGLADAVAYEMEDMTLRWRRLLDALAEHVRTLG